MVGSSAAETAGTHCCQKAAEHLSGFESLTILIDLPLQMATGKEVLEQMSSRGSLDVKFHA